MTTDQQILDAARSALLKRLRGDAYEGYTTAELEFKGMPLVDLEALITRYEQRIVATQGTNFHLAEPFEL